MSLGKKWAGLPSPSEHRAYDADAALAVGTEGSVLELPDSGFGCRQFFHGIESCVAPPPRLCRLPRLPRRPGSDPPGKNRAGAKSIWPGILFLCCGSAFLQPWAA